RSRGLGPERQTEHRYRRLRLCLPRSPESCSPRRHGKDEARSHGISAWAGPWLRTLLHLLRPQCVSRYDCVVGCFLMARKGARGKNFFETTPSIFRNRIQR
ncbi:unnamed protein product, partial [Scytosiphon promiscuus]